MEKKYSIISYQDYLEYKKESINLKYNWVKSIIVFVFPYPKCDVKSNGKYLPAYFARIKDYHKIVKKELEKIANENLDDSKYEVLVDISFLDEKTCAVMSGLGSIGKNDLLLTKEYGSRVFIGEIVTDKVLTPLKNERLSLCLDCKRCINACPNNALVNGFEKNKCLSFLSQKKENSYQLYDKMELYYGCDICQNVCPLNRNIENINQEFNQDLSSMLSLDDIKDLTKIEFKEKYQDFAFNWIGLLRILRNIIVLEVNNNNITIDDLKQIQDKYKDEKWFYDHLEYLKGKLK